MNENNLIHSDLKPDNILIKSKIDELKIIDFGSVFDFNSKGNVSMTTPEYMSPELLELI
jgi:serine/threonine protein kinase